jgi:hypothetical protein
MTEINLENTNEEVEEIIIEGESYSLEDVADNDEPELEVEP